ncbi:MAG: ATP-dependent Clp protease proteolytic subunit [Proteobacteria bacterium]|nr:ATP-dependent Clp protease proteolytic subunit [Pseudomonadota bacterium]
MPDKTVYIRFFAEVNPNTAKALMTMVEQKLKEGATKFVLLISSGGGNTYAGISAYNFMKGIPAQVETHNFGMANSVALVLFCAGAKRLSAPHATFLLHGVQANFPQGAALEEDQLAERLKGLQLDTENIAGIVATTTRKPEADVLKDMRGRTALNPEQAMEYGLVHEIKEPLFEKGAELLSIQ